MTKYREILRLKSLGFSERNIAQSCGVSRNTVAKVLKKAAEINLSWPVPLAWKHASTTIQCDMYDFLIYYWTYRLPGTMELFRLS